MEYYLSFTAMEKSAHLRTRMLYSSEPRQTMPKTNIRPQRRPSSHNCIMLIIGAAWYVRYTWYRSTVERMISCRI
ncbi:unnamed protein product [Gongylonema pulchrum]|uniref:Uncharacterized protein n=1 Tax=Gongylonema pulchrum TaxID=637853 RepID=A0A183DHV7_9BILA|nr:unnamed protein product [Gongylonema pulchrum]